MTKENRTALRRALRDAGRVVVEYRCRTCVDGVARLTVSHAGMASRAALEAITLTAPACPRCGREARWSAVLTPKAVYVGRRRVTVQQLGAACARIVQFAQRLRVAPR